MLLSMIYTSLDISRGIYQSNHMVYTLATVALNVAQHGYCLPYPYNTGSLIMDILCIITIAWNLL
jgi:hypothetical protein